MIDKAETNAQQAAAATRDEASTAVKAPQPDLRARQEALLDEGVQETFPASDPVAVMRLL